MSETNRARQAALGRREFVSLGVGVLVVGAVPWAARRRVNLVRRTLPVMGTVADIVVATRDARAGELAIDAALAELERVERLMTRFRDTSDIGRANRQAAAAPVRVDPATAMVVDEALAWAAASEGRFDPAIGRVTEIWDVTHRHEPPPATEVARLAGRQLYRQVERGTQHGQPVLRFQDVAVQLDLGAIATGYGVDLAVAALRDRGISSGLVNVGGDLYAIGSRPDGDPWRVGIQSPSEPSRLSRTLDVGDGAVATSGDYEQFFRYRGVVYHHLMDPETAAPRRTRVHSVSVRADCCMDADAGSTAVYGLDAGAAAQLLERRGRGVELLDME